MDTPAAAMRDADERAGFLFESNPMPMWLYDIETLAFLDVNRAAVSLYGYSREEFLSMTLRDIRPADEVPDLLANVAQRRPDFEFSRGWRHKRKDGSLLNVEITSSAVRFGDCDARFVLATDVTERKRAEALLTAAYERQARIAETLQRAMLLSVAEDTFPGLSVATFYEAALAEAQVGGDFFDVLTLGEGKVALAVGDVSGKGLAAATRTAEVKYALRALLHEYPSPSLALTRLNTFICNMQSAKTTDLGMFVAISLAVVDSISRQVTFSAAGAEPPRIVGSTDTLEAASLASLPIGIHQGAPYAELAVRLEPEAVLLLATDGLTEARQGRNFLGMDGLAHMAAAAENHASLYALGEAVMEEVRLFSGGHLRDDACLLLCRLL